MAYAVEFQQVSRHYGDVRAVDNVSMTIEDGEFFSMLGPSGSGKTTCLRMIAGFEQLSEGAIRLFGQEASQLPPWARDVNTVFQDYALFPHMSVLENVAYGLMVKGVDKKTRLARAREALERVALGFTHARKPSQLSGGSVSASPSPARWSISRASCCWMSRSARSISNCASRCRSN